MPNATCETALRSPLCRLAETFAMLGGLVRFRTVRNLLGQRDLGRRLTCCWLLALGLVGLASACATALTLLLAASHRDHGAVINDAASQRTRAQRIAAYLPELLAEDPFEVELARLELARILGRMEAVFRGLVDGEAPPARRTPALVAHYFDGKHPLAPRLARFLADARAILRDVEEGLSADPEAVAALREEALGPLLGLLDEAVTLHEAHLRQDVDRLLVASLGVGAALLLLLVAIALWIFRPMTRALAATVGDLAGLAYADPLTGVANRRAVIEGLARAIEAGRSLAAIAIDLDHFKEANESAGHAGGDALLKAAAERLRASVRAGDIVGRIGGDEFVVFLRDVRSEAELRPIVERIRAVLHEPVPLDGRLLPLGATLGVAICPDDTADPEILLRLADEALLRAKRERRGSIGRARREDALAIEVARDLRTLLDRASPDEPPAGLAALLQPVVALGEGAGPALLGFEALARWVHPRLGSISPTLLFGAAADRRSAIRLGRLVRRVALVTFAALRDRLPAGTRLSLNLSPAEVFADGLEEEILADLEATGVPPGRLCLEITEEVLLDRVSDRRLAGLAALRGRGIALALDDFGTGTSGLAQLLRLPIDLLKIDRCFVRAIEHDGRAREIVRATVALARTLGMQVVAEGVESVAQARQLESLGCAAAQGFLFGRPMGLVELHRWLEDRGETARSASRSGGRPLGRPEHALDPDDPAEPPGEMSGFGRAHASELQVDHELVPARALTVAAVGHVAHRREHLEHARQRRRFGPSLDGKAEGDGHGRTP
jgi:diguanylate cyclase (GGDEF)-like protein